MFPLYIVPHFSRFVNIYYTFCAVNIYKNRRAGGFMIKQDIKNAKKSANL